MTQTLDLTNALHERGALLDGHFRLSSGRHSNRFIQKFRILERPPLVEAVAKEIAAAFRSAKPTIVVSAAVGGVVLGYEVARQLGTDAIFVEKENGVAKLRRSFHLTPDDRVLVHERRHRDGDSRRKQRPAAGEPPHDDEQRDHEGV